MMKKFIGIFFLIFNIGLYAEGENIIVPMIPLLPSMPANPEAEGKPVPLETKTIIMKMETEIVAPAAGTVASISVSNGDSVDTGAVLVTLS